MVADSDGQRFLRHPAGTQLLDGLRAGLGRFGVPNGSFEGPRGLGVLRPVLKFDKRDLDCLPQGGASAEFRDDPAQGTSGEIPRRVPVRECSDLGTEQERVSGDQPDRGHTHHTAAAFAVIQRGGQAGGVFPQTPAHLILLARLFIDHANVVRRRRVREVVRGDFPGCGSPQRREARHPGGLRVKESSPAQ